MRKLDDEQMSWLIRPVVASWSKTTLKEMADSPIRRDIAIRDIITALRGSSIELISYGSTASPVRNGMSEADKRRATVRLGARLRERLDAERAVIDALCTLDEIDKAFASFIRS